MKRASIKLVTILTICGTAMGNGGPIDISYNLGAGNLRLVQMADITLESEILSIVPVGDVVHVRATYVLRNDGGSAITEYGFPVEIDVGDMWDEMPASLETLVFINDGAVPLPLEVESVEGETTAGAMGDYEVEGRTDWYTTSLVFEPGETKTLSVYAMIPASYSDYATSKGFLPGYSERYFRYDLSPASYWGTGIAGEFHASVDLSWVTEHGGELTTMDGPVERRDETTWTVSGKDFPMENAGMIEFSYSVSRWKDAQLIQEHAIPGWQLVSYEVSTELTSQGERSYEAGNLFDGDRTTAWVEGAPGNGKGQWIEVELPEDFGLGTIALVNGYQASMRTYTANGRPARVRIEVFLSEGRTDERTVDLEDLSWEEVQADPTGGMQVLYDCGMVFAADSFRIEILDVHPGTDYDDTCISELIIMGNPGGFWLW